MTAFPPPRVDRIHGLFALRAEHDTSYRMRIGESMCDMSLNPKSSASPAGPAPSLTPAGSPWVGVYSAVYPLEPASWHESCIQTGIRNDIAHLATVCKSLHSLCGVQDTSPDAEGTGRQVCETIGESGSAGVEAGLPDGIHDCIPGRLEPGISGRFALPVQSFAQPVHPVSQRVRLAAHRDTDVIGDSCRWP